MCNHIAFNDKEENIGPMNSQDGRLEPSVHLHSIVLKPYFNSHWNLSETTVCNVTQILSFITTATAVVEESKLQIMLNCMIITHIGTVANQHTSLVNNVHMESD